MTIEKLKQDNEQLLRIVEQQKKEIESLIQERTLSAATKSVVSELIQTAKETTQKLNLSQKQVLDYKNEIEQLRQKVESLESDNRKLRFGDSIQQTNDRASEEPKIIIEKHRHTQIQIKEQFLEEMLQVYADPKNSERRRTEEARSRLIQFSSVNDWFNFQNRQTAGSQSLVKHTMDQKGTRFIGEHNENNKLHGRGIIVYESGSIWIGYWNNGTLSDGDYIAIGREGLFDVGVFYRNAAGKAQYKGTRYKPDSTS